MNKYRTPSMWRNIFIINDENQIVCRYEINERGKLKIPFKSDLTSISKKQASLIKPPKKCNENLQLDKKNINLTLTQNIIIFSTQITKPKISFDNTSQSHNEDKIFDIDIDKIKNSFSSLDDPNYDWFFFDQNDDL